MHSHSSNKTLATFERMSDMPDVPDMLCCVSNLCGRNHCHSWKKLGLGWHCHGNLGQEAKPNLLAICWLAFSQWIYKNLQDTLRVAPGAHKPLPSCIICVQERCSKLYQPNRSAMLCSNVLAISSSSSSSSSSCKWIDSKYLFYIPTRTATTKPIERCDVYPIITNYQSTRLGSGSVRCPPEANAVLLSRLWNLSSSKESASTWDPSHLSGHIHKLLLFDRKHLFDREHLCTKKICGPKVMRLFIVQNFCLQRLLWLQTMQETTGCKLEWLMHVDAFYFGRDILTE